MFHCLDVLHANSYVLYQQASLADERVTNKTRIVDHKTFTKTLIGSLINRAATAKKDEDGDKSKKEKPERELRPPLDHNNPSLSIYNRWRIGCSETKLVTAPTQTKCKYCSYKRIKHRLLGMAVPRNKTKARLWCAHCQINLCRGCFTPFHTEE